MAVSGAGAVAKTAVGVAGRLRRQWLRWLTEHGDAYEYDATVGPTVEHVLHFQTHGGFGENTPFMNSLFSEYGTAYSAAKPLFSL